MRVLVRLPRRRVIAFITISANFVATLLFPTKQLLHYTHISCKRLGFEETSLRQEATRSGPFRGGQRIAGNHLNQALLFFVSLFFLCNGGRIVVVFVLCLGLPSLVFPIDLSSDTSDKMLERALRRFLLPVLPS